MDKVASVSCVGDFGNPSGTGISGVQVTFSSDTPATAITEVSTFFAAIKTAQLTACNQSDLALQYKSPALNTKPGASVNVDRVLLATWRLKTDSAIHRITIPGVPETSTGISDMPEGERLNETGKLALASAIETCGGFAEDSVVVLQGKVFQKK